MEEITCSTHANLPPFTVELTQPEGYRGIDFWPRVWYVLVRSVCISTTCIALAGRRAGVPRAQCSTPFSRIPHKSFNDLINRTF